MVQHPEAAARKCSVNKVFLKYLCWSLFLVKSQALGLVAVTEYFELYNLVSKLKRHTFVKGNYPIFIQI